MSGAGLTDGALSAAGDDNELRGVPIVSRRTGNPQHPHHLPDTFDAAAHRVDRLGQHLLEAAVGVDEAQFGDDTVPGRGRWRSRP